MLRRTLALLAGLAAWLVVVSLVNRLLRFALEGYAAAEPSMGFTLTMLLARLAMAALSSIVAGYVVAKLAPQGARLVTLLGVVLLLFFLPVHYQLWSSFPAWYHLVFLGTLVPLAMLGGRMARAAQAAQAKPAG